MGEGGYNVSLLLAKDVKLYKWVQLGGKDCSASAQNVGHAPFRRRRSCADNSKPAGVGSVVLAKTLSIIAPAPTLSEMSSGTMGVNPAAFKLAWQANARTTMGTVARNIVAMQI